MACLVGVMSRLLLLLDACCSLEVCEMKRKPAARRKRERQTKRRGEMRDEIGK